MRLPLAMTIRASIYLRPPGTMLVCDGDTITKEPCTGGEMALVSVALCSDAPEKIDLGCELSAARIGALPLAMPDEVPA